MDLNKFIAGGLSGIVEVIATHPIDYVKIKKQEYKQQGKTFLLSKVAPQKYLTGLLPRLIGVSPMRVVFWGVQDNTKTMLISNNINTKFNFLIIAMNGAFFQTLIDNQIELFKIGIMTKKSNEEILKSLFKYKGFNVCLLRNIGFTSSISYFCFSQKNNDNAVNKFINSAIGGLIGSVITQPLDYVKTQQQRCNDNRSIYKILEDTMKEDSKKLFVGGAYRALLSITSMSVGFISYNFFINQLQ